MKTILSLLIFFFLLAPATLFAQVLVNDDFNGNAGAYANNTYWTYNWPGQAPDTGPTLDGNGSLVITGGGGPFGSGVSGLNSTGNKISAADTSNTLVTFE